MHKIFASIFFAGFCLAFISMAQQKKTRIVFFGDSITQMGVNAGGYINQMTDSLKARNLSGQYELIGAGIGGNQRQDYVASIHAQ